MNDKQWKALQVLNDAVKELVEANDVLEYPFDSYWAAVGDKLGNVLTTTVSYTEVDATEKFEKLVAKDIISYNNYRPHDQYHIREFVPVLI